MNTPILSCLVRKSVTEEKVREKNNIISGKNLVEKVRNDPKMPIKGTAEYVRL